MIRRLVAMFRCERCQEVDDRADRAYRRFEVATAGELRRLLNLINATMPDIDPYPPGKLEDALVEVARRARLRRIRNGEPPLVAVWHHPSVEVADEALSAGRGHLR